jgi:hypothetical protein
MRVVLDTNVLLSALLGKGPMGAIFDMVEAGELEMFLTPEILEELKRVLRYPKILKWLHTVGLDAGAVMQYVIEHAKLVEDVKIRNIVKADPSDDKFIGCALSVGAKYIVSGDRHLLDIGSVGGVDILSPRDFLRRVAHPLPPV